MFNVVLIMPNGMRIIAGCGDIDWCWDLAQETSIEYAWCTFVPVGVALET